MNRKRIGFSALLVGLMTPTLMIADPGLCYNASNLVQNCGFETPGTLADPFPSWTVSPPDYNQTVNFEGTFGNDSGPNSGAQFAMLGATGADVTLSQTIYNLQAGQQYSFSFWLASDGTSVPNPSVVNDFTATWDNTTVFSETNIPYQSYVLESFTEIATSTQATIAFSARNDPGYLGLDDVSVSLAEPNSAALGFGLLILWMLRIHRLSDRRNSL